MYTHTHTYTYICELNFYLWVTVKKFDMHTHRQFLMLYRLSVVNKKTDVFPHIAIITMQHTITKSRSLCYRSLNVANVSEI